MSASQTYYPAGDAAFGRVLSRTENGLAKMETYRAESVAFIGATANPERGA